MTLNMVNAPSTAVGNMTSGGTESVLLAVKTYRDRARALFPHITKPEMILCNTAHVAFPKAAAYFDVQTVYVPFDKDYKMDIAAVRKAITANTILIVGSAPQYPHGCVDPIEELASIALEHNFPLHVDACIGGFLLPWIEQLGYPVPAWDFRVKGVTSISADVHKYGYAVKGASTLSWLNHNDYRQYQYFAFGDWPGGIFASPSMLGTRNGGCIAAAWAAMIGLGKEGYLEKAKLLMETTQKFIEGIRSIPSIEILGSPIMAIIAFRSTNPAVNIFAVSDILHQQFGWQIGKNTFQFQLCSVLCSVTVLHIVLCVCLVLYRMSTKSFMCSSYFNAFSCSTS